VVAHALSCLSLFSEAEAVNPPPDGGYPGGNTAEGQNALLSLTTGTYNTAVGLYSLKSNTVGQLNTAVGASTLPINSAGTLNTAVGGGALASNTLGNQNTAVGTFALLSNAFGGGNTAIGSQALFHNATGATTGNANTAVGAVALFNNTIGSGNIALGNSAGSSVTTANNTICIGSNVAGANVDNTTWIGNVYGATTVSGTTLPVIVSDSGQLGTASSSRRFKREIESMDKSSEAILALKPVTFHYKSDKTDTPQFGLIAEEVAKVNPDLVARDKNGEIYTFSLAFEQLGAHEVG
jgi:hypothetical protein